MRKLPPVEFEWDPDRAISNLEKHDLSFEEAATAFGGSTRSVSERVPTSWSSPPTLLPDSRPLRRSTTRSGNNFDVLPAATDDSARQPTATLRVAAAERLNRCTERAVSVEGG